MGKALVLAIASAFYPTLIAFAVLILARPQPVKLFAGFLIGGMTVSIAAGLAILAFADPDSIGSGSSGATRPVLSLVVGVLLVALAVSLQTGHDLPMAERRAARKAAKAERASQTGEGPKPSRMAALVERDSLWLAIVLGAVFSVPSVWYLSALSEIGSRDYSGPTQIVIVAAFNLIMFALIEASLAFCLLDPERTAEAVARFDVWTGSHMRQIGIAVAGFGGIYLIVKALITFL